MFSAHPCPHTTHGLSHSVYSLNTYQMNEKVNECISPDLWGKEGKAKEGYLREERVSDYWAVKNNTRCGTEKKPSAPKRAGNHPQRNSWNTQSDSKHPWPGPGPLRH